MLTEFTAANEHERQQSEHNRGDEKNLVGRVVRIPEAVVALIFGMLGFLVVGRRDFS